MKFIIAGILFFMLLAVSFKVLIKLIILLFAISLVTFIVVKSNQKT